MEGHRAARKGRAEVCCWTAIGIGHRSNLEDSAAGTLGSVEHWKQLVNGGLGAAS